MTEERYVFSVPGVSSYSAIDSVCYQYNSARGCGCAAQGWGAKQNDLREMALFLLSPDCGFWSCLHVSCGTVFAEPGRVNCPMWSSTSECSCSGLFLMIIAVVCLVFVSPRRQVK